MKNCIHAFIEACSLAVVALAAGLSGAGCSESRVIDPTASDASASDASTPDSSASDSSASDAGYRDAGYREAATRNAGAQDTAIRDDGAQDTAIRDGGADADVCEQREQAYEQFLAANQSCQEDTDCEVIGDCGPNADFAAVRAHAAARARELQLRRCSSIWDGPVYRPVCRAGRCSLEEIPGDCCGCPQDAGF